MRVFYYRGCVVNAASCSLDTDRMIAAGAEEIPSEIFGELPHLASRRNTFKIDGQWFFEPSVDVETTKAAKLAAIQAAKVAARDGGFEVDGVLFDSDAGARLAYLELENSLGEDADYATPWKASGNTWVTMDAALYALVKAAGTAHIAAVFAWQAARTAEVQAADTIEALESVPTVFIKD